MRLYVYRRASGVAPLESELLVASIPPVLCANLLFPLVSLPGFLFFFGGLQRTGEFTAWSVSSRAKPAWGPASVWPIMQSRL